MKRSKNCHICETERKNGSIRLYAKKPAPNKEKSKERRLKSRIKADFSAKRRGGELQKKKEKRHSEWGKTEPDTSGEDKSRRENAGVKKGKPLEKGRRSVQRSKSVLKKRQSRGDYERG